METISKISETEYEKVTPQVDKVEKRSLDSLLLEKESLLTGIQNNKDRITEQTAKLVEVNAEIEQVRALNVKTSAEVKVVTQATLEKQPTPLPEEIKP